MYLGPGSFAPVDHLTRTGLTQPYQQGYNVADYLLEVASDPPLALLQSPKHAIPASGSDQVELSNNMSMEKVEDENSTSIDFRVNNRSKVAIRGGAMLGFGKSKYATTFLTQLEYLSGREWKVLRR